MTSHLNWTFLHSPIKKCGRYVISLRARLLIGDFPPKKAVFEVSIHYDVSNVGLLNIF